MAVFPQKSMQATDCVSGSPNRSEAPYFSVMPLTTVWGYSELAVRNRELVQQVITRVHQAEMPGCTN